MIACKECVAGFGHTSSLWFHFEGNQMIGYTVETPEGIENSGPDAWFEQHMLIVKTSKKHVQKSIDAFPYLTFVAGQRAVQAIRDYHIYELALAFTSQYGWQIINGAKILPPFGELAKVYAGIFAIFLFRSNVERDAALEAIDNGQTF